MKDSFFISAGAKRSRPQSQQKQDVPTKKKGSKGKSRDKKEEARLSDTDEDIDNLDLRHSDAASDSDASLDEESAQEKRVRLAKSYIESLKEKPESGDYDAAELDRDIIADRLKADLLEDQGRLYRPLADQIKGNSFRVKIIPAHFMPVTCVAVTPDEKFVYSGSKDGNIVKCELETGRRVHVIQSARKNKKPNSNPSSENIKGHTGKITCLAISSDGQFLASGSEDKSVCIWSIGDNRLLTQFKQHRDTITGLAFRNGTNYLYTASDDRTAKVYNVDDLAYVETLFGHQDKITDLDSFGSKEKCISTGGRDRTVRLWKIAEESQLVFRASAGKVKSSSTEESQSSAWLKTDDTGSVDCVSFLNDDTWITGSDGGTLCVWNPMRKKPVFSLPNAHGRICTFELENDNDNVIEVDNSIQPEQTLYSTNIYEHTQCLHLERGNLEAVSEYLDSIADKCQGEIISRPNWISTVRCFPYSNLVASGSCDGHIRLWKYGGTKGKRAIEDDSTEKARSPLLIQIAKIPMQGWINSLRFSKSGRYLVAAVGREPKGGRWLTVKKAKNCIAIIDLQPAESLQD